jgi:hypothetical protein
LEGQAGDRGEEGRQEMNRWMTSFEIRHDDQIGDRVVGRFKELQTGIGREEG